MENLEKQICPELNKPKAKCSRKQLEQVPEDLPENDMTPKPKQQWKQSAVCGELICKSILTLL